MIETICLIAGFVAGYILVHIIGKCIDNDNKKIEGKYANN